MGDFFRAMRLVVVLVAIGWLPHACVSLPHTSASADATKFLEDYAAQSGTVALPSGLLYKVLKEGHGGKPSVQTPCRCHYEGMLSRNYPGGPTFDSSYKRGEPTTFAPNQVIKGWTEAMQLMPVGSKWELVCPPEIAYGSSAMGRDIPAHSVLVFKMELLSCDGVADDVPQTADKKAAPVSLTQATEASPGKAKEKAAGTAEKSQKTAENPPSSAFLGMFTGARPFMLAVICCMAMLMCVCRGGGKHHGRRMQHHGGG